MFRRIEAHDYRCLHSVEQSVNPFEILIGSNASGKSTFLDVIGFLGDMVSDGLESAVERRTTNFHDLVWGRQGDRFDLAVEATIPEDRRVEIQNHGRPDTIQYQVLIRLDTMTESLHIEHEHVEIYSYKILSSASFNVVIRSGGLKFVSEAGFNPYEREQPHRNYSALNNIPVDAEFPATAWLRDQLRRGIRTVALDVKELRKPSPPAASAATEPSGAYLARSVAQLKSRNHNEFARWLVHIRTVFPDIKDVRTVLREEDRHRYVVIDYRNGIAVPSWMISEGTLRLMALTLLAYAADPKGVYLIEEPENGIHPAALQAVYESLSSIYDGQVLIASHSPVLLSMAKPEQLLCFAATADGARIVRGSEHQALQDWQGEVSLGMLAASGILG
jgi:predicted ATPase